MSFIFDANGNVVSHTTRRGKVITFAYDSLDQLQSQTADGQTTTFKADGAEKYTVANVPGVSYDSVAFDMAGRAVAQVTTRGSHTDTLRSGYEKHGLRDTLSISGPWSASILYAYNAELQLQSITDLAGQQTTLGYNVDHQLTSVILPPPLSSPHLTVTTDYSATHTPGLITYSDASINSLLGANYTSTPTSQLDKRVSWYINNEEGGRQFSYDEAGRLTGYADYTAVTAHRDQNCGGIGFYNPNTGENCWIDSARTTSDSVTYSYDRVGNRNDQDSSVTLAAGNRLTHFKTDSMLYDLDGNLVKRWTVGGGRVDSLVWNSVDQLVTIIHNGATTSFAYDGLGRRIQKISPIGTSNYLWDGTNLFAELDQNWSRVAEYVYYPGDDEPNSVRRHGSADSVFYYLSDVPGKTSGLVNSAGTLVDRYSYRPYGELDDSSVTVANALRYGGREFDPETGLYYQRARYYDPSLGRFVSEDPAGLAAGMNLYTYASGDPISGRDPSGLADVHCPTGWTAFRADDKGDGSVDVTCTPPPDGSGSTGSGAGDLFGDMGLPAGVASTLSGLFSGTGTAFAPISFDMDLDDPRLQGCPKGKFTYLKIDPGVRYVAVGGDFYRLTINRSWGDKASAFANQLLGAVEYSGFAFMQALVGPLKGVDLRLPVEGDIDCATGTGHISGFFPVP